MSNCVSIRNEAVTFGPEEMDLPALLLALEAHKDCKGFEAHGRDVDLNWACQTAQWFLVQGRNVESTARGVRVRFGHGNSSHTWRDFKGTVLFLDQFMLRTKTHVFDLRDDDMGGGRFGKSIVVFAPGEKKHVFLSDMEQELTKVEAQVARLEGK